MTEITGLEFIVLLASFYLGGMGTVFLMQAQDEGGR